VFVLKTFSFEKLQVWQDSKNLAVMLYRYTSSFPSEEKYGLTSQIRRAIVSVSSNIAEGSSRNTKRDQAHFYGMAYSSLTEVLSQILIAHELGFIDETQVNEIRSEIEKVSNKLNALRNAALKQINK
jgi:four helix bundle protein